jgi:hypothetical protein
LFPCGSQPDWTKQEVVPTMPTALKCPSTDTVPMEPSGSPKSTKSIKSTRLARKTSSARLVSSLFPGDSDPYLVPNLSTRIDYLEILDPKNHAKLKAAWDTMLHHRFLPPGLLSVLQFYFAAEFDQVQTFPTIQIDLPPNTRLYSQDLTMNPPTNEAASPQPPDAVALGSPGASSGTTSRRGSLAGNFSPIEQSSLNILGSSEDATLHLGRMVSLVQGCKETIWKEYIALESPQPATFTQVCDLRDEFDAAWLNWEW